MRGRPNDPVRAKAKARAHAHHWHDCQACGGGAHGNGGWASHKYGCAAWRIVTLVERPGTFQEVTTEDPTSNEVRVATYRRALLNSASLPTTAKRAGSAPADRVRLALNQLWDSLSIPLKRAADPVRAKLEGLR